MRPVTENQTPFDLRVFQFALHEVVSDEDAEWLARMILRLTESKNAWADASFAKGEQLALKSLICFEVMRSIRKQMGQSEAADDGFDDARSFANLYKAIESSDRVLANDGHWQDYATYSPKDFLKNIFIALETRLSSFKQLGPLETRN